MSDDDTIDPTISWACERLTARYAHLVDEGPLTVSGPTLIGVYRDRFVRTAGGWRFAERRCDVDFTRGPA